MMNRIDLVRPDAPPLAGYGPYPVGVKTRDWADSGRIDVIASGDGPLRRGNRPLRAEVWYPAKADTVPGTAYVTDLRDGATQAVLQGRACRDAVAAPGDYPLVVISHGYPGNRFLMSHLGETLASRGFVVVAVDHADSTYADKGPIESTLVNRPLDVRCVIDRVAAEGLANTARVGVIGYSMGGYGALILGGAGLSEAAMTGARADLMAQHRAGVVQVDPRIACILPIGPWGGARGLWDADGLAGLCVPCLMIAGSADDISGYAAMRDLFAGSVGAARWLLTFQLAGHNAGAPIPAPAESWLPVDTLDFVPFEHYADPVWDTVRMNNVTQHFAAAFLGLHLRGDAGMAEHLTPGEPGPGLTLEAMHP